MPHDDDEANDDDAANAVAMDLMVRSRVCDLRDLAAEISALAKPAIPLTIPRGPAAVTVLLLALAAERRRCRRLLKLLADAE